jgi:hypothetical protein
MSNISIRKPQGSESRVMSRLESEDNIKVNLCVSLAPLIEVA